MYDCVIGLGAGAGRLRHGFPLAVRKGHVLLVKINGSSENRLPKYTAL